MAKKTKNVKKRCRCSVALVILIIVAAFAAGTATGYLIPKKIPVVFSPGSCVVGEEVSHENISASTALSLEGFVKANITIEAPATVVMTSGCRQISAETTEPQAYSIELALENKTGDRPQTHDLMRDIFENFGIEVLQAKITSFNEEVGTYLARLIVQQSQKVLDLDSRPTDAIAIAYRVGVPVYINETLIKEKGEKIC